MARSAPVTRPKMPHMRESVPQRPGGWRSAMSRRRAYTVAAGPENSRSVSLFSRTQSP